MTGNMTCGIVEQWVDQDTQWCYHVQKGVITCKRVDQDTQCGKQKNCKLNIEICKTVTYLKIS